MKPQARIAGLVIREFPDELVVYDTATHRAHCLNATAALVFLHSDGRRSVRDLAVLVAGTSADADEAPVHAALERLAEAGLLERQPGPHRPELRRREVLRQVGLGAVVLAPVVTSLLVPSPAEAAATCIPQTACQPGINDGQACYNSMPLECANKTCQPSGLCQ
jgi:Coenzyme PQQ synthesis protein D (PqqD)